MRTIATLVLLVAALGPASAQSVTACATIEQCDAVIRASPGIAAFERRGFLHLMRRDLDPAIADFSAAIGIDGSRAFSLYGRGMARLMAGDAAGQNEMEFALMLQPGVADAFKAAAR